MARLQLIWWGWRWALRPPVWGLRTRMPLSLRPFYRAFAWLGPVEVRLWWERDGWERQAK